MRNTGNIRRKGTKEGVKRGEVGRRRMNGTGGFGEKRRNNAVTG